ncbi:MAG: hypothetical protein ACFCVD_18415 [Nodosilinea sp.]
MAAAPDDTLAQGTYLTTAAALRLDEPVQASYSDPPPQAIFSFRSAATAPDPVPFGQALLAQAQPSRSPALPEDPELGVVRVRNPIEDPELGILRIREQPTIPTLPAPEPPKTAFLSARFSVASSDNVLLVVNDVGGLTGDTFFRPAVTLAFYPVVGPETVLIGTVDYAFQRYSSQSDVNYDDLRFRVGVRQGLFPRTYGQIAFSYQQLFRPGPSRVQFFDSKALSFTLGRRDPLTPRLGLDTFYQVQFSDAEVRSPASTGTVSTDFDRLSQIFGGYLGYNITPQLQTGVSYQLTLSDYTTQERYDTYHQLLGQLVYSITPEVRLSFYGGWSFGRSSNPNIQFDDTLFGFTIDATVPLF